MNYYTGYNFDCNDYGINCYNPNLHMQDIDFDVFQAVYGEYFDYDDFVERFGQDHEFIFSGADGEWFDENLEQIDAPSQGVGYASGESGSGISPVINPIIHIGDAMAHIHAHSLHGTDDVAHWVSLYVRIMEVLIITLGILGIIGNIVIFCGLRSDKKSTSTTFLLKTLAMTDIFFLMTSAAFYLNDLIRVYDIGGDVDSLYHRKIHPYADVLVYPLRKTAHALTVWVVCLVGIHRFIVICYPLRAKQWCRTKIFKGFVAFAGVLSTLFCIEGWIDYKLVPIRYHSLPMQNKTFTLIRPRFENSMMMAWVFDSIIYQIAVFALPFILLLFITIRLIVEMRKNKRKRAAMTVSANNNQEKSITRAIVLVLIVFTLCQATLGVNTFLLVCRFYKEQCFNTQLMRIATDLLYPTQEMFLVLDSSINFVIYVLVSKRYRQLMLGKFCKCIVINKECEKSSKTDETRTK